jgi:hypothetical protein
MLEALISLFLAQINPTNRQGCLSGGAVEKACPCSGTFQATSSDLGDKAATGRWLQLDL